MNQQLPAFTIRPDDLPAIARVQYYIDDIAPENEAPIPIAFSLEKDPTDDEWKWFSYLHVRTPLLGDLDCESKHVELRESALGALRNLRRETSIAQQAAA